MKDVNELRRKKGVLVKEARSVIDKAAEEKRDASQEENDKIKQLFSDIDKSDAEITEEETHQQEDRNRRERLEKEERRLREHSAAAPIRPDPTITAASPVTITEEHRSLALQGWARVQCSLDVEKRHEEALKICGMESRRKEIGIDLRMGYHSVRKEFRDLSAITGAAGGFTVPEGFVPMLEIALLQFGGMRQVADVMRTETGNALPWPTSNDTSNEGEIVGENADFGASVDPTFGAVMFNAYKYSSKPILVPFELLQDNAVNLASVLGTMIGERIGRHQNKHFTVGDAASKPKGIVTASTLGVTAASATAIKADELLTLQHKVDPAYRPGAMYMLHDDILLEIRKLKDGQGQYIWQPGLIAGIPNLMVGFPYMVNQAMDNTMAAGKKTLLFGQLGKYKIRDVQTIRMKRLEERYAEKDQIAFIAFMRSDGNLLDAGVAPVKHLVH